MNLMWRFLWTFLFARFGPGLSIFDEANIHFYVLPTDIDVLMHMNNGRYFSIMDIARMDFMIRANANASQKLIKNKIYPVVASEMVRFKKSLNLFQRFEIKTRLLGWDEKFFYVMHHFTVKQQTYAISIVKVAFLRKAKSISSRDVLAVLNIDQPSPVLPQWIHVWSKADLALYKTDKHLFK